MKTITVFSQGNANSSKTWSNIPYYLVETLKEKNFKVHSVNVDDNGFRSLFFNKFLCRLVRHTFFPHTTYSYDRTRMFQHRTNGKMKKSIQRFQDTDIFISTSFSFHPKAFTKKPCVILCDWSYEYLINHFMNRNPDFFEKKGIQIQDSVISSADLVVSLFPDVAEHMASRYSNTRVVYLGNVINSLPFNFDSKITSTRFFNPHIVFVGLPKYKEGLASLMKAINLLNEQQISIHLDVIGMTEYDSPLPPTSNVCFHGYLEKSDAEQLKKYNSILSTALAFINTTPHWAGFSSALEAMYHGLPIFTSIYNSFVETFGENIDFGGYCNNNDPQEIEVFIKMLLALKPEEYDAICMNARKKAEPFTWSAYVDKILIAASDI